jgi:protein gp37
VISKQSRAAVSAATFQVLTKRSDRVRKLGANLPWPRNVWMGVSVEDSRVLPRIDDLREVPAVIRFLSCEPLIGSLAEIDLRGIHCVIVGGESGPGSRAMNTELVREIFRACRNQKVPFFFKQWGGVRKDLSGRRLGGRTYDEMPTLVAA